VGQRIRVMQLLGVCPKRSLSCNGVEDNQIEIFSTPAKNFNRLGCILFFTILEMPASIDTLSKSFRWLLYATVFIVGFLATFNNIAFRSFLEKNNNLFGWQILRILAFAGTQYRNSGTFRIIDHDAAQALKSTIFALPILEYDSLSTVDYRYGKCC
jgi:hypothetical protein